MRVCILYAGVNRESQGLKTISEALGRGIESQGNTVDIFNMQLDQGKSVSFYDYVIIGTESTGFFGGKIPVGPIREFFKTAGTLSGKRSMRLSVKADYVSRKPCRRS